MKALYLFFSFVLFASCIIGCRSLTTPTGVKESDASISSTDDQMVTKQAEEYTFPAVIQDDAFYSALTQKDCMNAISTVRDYLLSTPMAENDSALTYYINRSDYKYAAFFHEYSYKDLTPEQLQPGLVAIVSTVIMDEVPTGFVGSIGPETKDGFVTWWDFILMRSTESDDWSIFSQGW